MMTKTATAPTIALDTRFGRFEVRDDSVLEFPEGLPGFEHVRRFVLLSSEEIAPLWCLQGLDGSAPSFLAVDPALVLEGYRGVLSDDDQTRLGPEEPRIWLALLTVVDGEEAAANLRAPIVINPKRMIGLQVIQARSPYAIDHPLALG
jgi:flagellar assembly factor FliW